MSDKERRATQDNTADAPTRRQFIARAFTAAAVLVVPAAITSSAPSVALAQDKDPDKYPDPTRTSDLPPASPSASRKPTDVPRPSPSTSPIALPQPSSSRPSTTPPPTSRGGAIKDEIKRPSTKASSKSFDSF
jgi:hypothetical protein